MKIGIITHNYPTGKNDRQNAGIFVYDMAHALKKINQEVLVLAPKGSDKAEKMNVPVIWFDWAGKGKKLGDLKLFNPLDLWLFLNLIYSGCASASKFSKENKIDFLVGMWAFPAGVFALWANIWNKTPYCLWTLGSDIYIYARYPILGFLIKTALKKAKFLVADGIDLAKQTTKIGGYKCQFLPSASSLPHKSISPKTKKGPLKFVFLGRMEPVKGPDVLVDAVTKIKDLDFELHLMGDGSLLPQLKQTVKDYGLEKKIIFYGNVNDPEVIFSRLSSSDWLVISSRSDSIPLVFSEGMKAKVPVIVADVGDMVELVKTYQVGLYFPKEDSKKLADILKKAIEQGRQMTEKYREKTVEMAEVFDINSSAKNLLTLINKE